MSDVLLILPPLGPPDIYIKPENKLSFHSYRLKKRATRVPQGLLSIGTVLLNLGYDIDILDCRLHYGNGREHFLETLKKKSKEARLLVGISLMSEQIPLILEIMDTIKKVDPNIPIVLGGIHPTLFPKQTCKDECVEFVISGDGEYPMAQLVEALDKGSSYKDIRGLTYKEGENVVSNPVGKPFDIRELGVPAYHLLEMEKYLTKIPWYSEEKTIGLEYNSSRGCPYDCSFCVNKILQQNRCWRCKPADQVIEELRILRDKYRFDYLFLEEENPLTDKKRAFEIAKKLINEDFNIRYFGNIRVDAILNTPKEILQTMRKSGWCETSIGCESGSNKVLGHLRKNITAEETIQAAKLLSKLDIYAQYSFMIFLPHETYKDRKLTYALMRKLKQIHPRSTFIGPQPFRPYPGSDLYKYCLSEGLAEPKTFRDWSNFMQQPSMPWVKDYSLTERLLEEPLRKLERRLQYLQDYGVKDTSKRVVESIIARITQHFGKASW